LTDFLGRVITAFADPDRLPTLRLQLMLGIAAMNDRGFVEQRVMMGTAGLEHLDGPDVVTQIRNRLVHPRGAQERVHRLGGLVAEVWLLTRHYLVLLILHSLGYQASYRNLRRTRGWAGEVGNVPWK
jgi:hypothetical protein